MWNETVIEALLVEDDDKLASLTKKYLEKHGVAVTIADDGDSGLKEALHYDFDVILLDIMLPGLNGIEVCRKLRERKDTPVIMITARGEEADCVMGLETGADDYVPKPFSPRELLARIRSNVRRVRGRMGPKRKVLKTGGLMLDPGSQKAVMKKQRLDLTSYEFSILFALAENAGRILSRERLMDLAGGNNEESFDRSIDVHISRLRKKLGDDPQKPVLIKTVRSLGYMYIDEEKQ